MGKSSINVFFSREIMNGIASGNLFELASWKFTAFVIGKSSVSRTP